MKILIACNIALLVCCAILMVQNHQFQDHRAATLVALSDSGPLAEKVQLDHTDGPPAEAEIPPEKTQIVSQSLLIEPELETKITAQTQASPRATPEEVTAASSYMDNYSLSKQKLSELLALGEYPKGS